MSNGKTICTVCNYIYDEALGDQAHNIRRSVKFDELPENWRCPECSSAKDMFQPCSCVGLGGKQAVPAIASVPVGQLIAEQPKRACVFEQYGIDYCCGGKQTLEEACKRKGVSIQEVIGKLSVADRGEQSPTDRDWQKAPVKELIEHIVSCYHQPLRQELPRVNQLAEKVAKVHGGNHPEMVELLEVFRLFREQLEIHMQKEELILFPGIAGMEAGGGPKSFGCGGSIDHPIEHMTQEHEDAGQALAAMRRLTNNYLPPADACNTFKVLLHSLSTLELEMHDHVHKENNILFPRALDLAKSASGARR